METKLDQFFQWLKREHAIEVDDPDMLREIFMEDEAFAEEIMQTAAQNIKQYGADIVHSIAETERPFYIAVHSLKSTVRSLGMNKAGNYYEEIERKLNDGTSLSASEKESLTIKNQEIENLVHQMIGFIKR